VDANRQSVGGDPTAAAELQACIVGATAAHRRLEAMLDRVDDAMARRPSRLPSWTVGHVLTHLARNADSHTRMLDAALAGGAVEQYAGGHEQRSRDIDAGARRPASELREDVRAADVALEEAWARMSPGGWAGHGLAEGIEWSCRLLPFHRWREVEIHHVDLGLGYSAADWPQEYVARELPLVLATLPGRLASETERSVLAWLLGRAAQPAVELSPWPSSSADYRQAPAGRVAEPTATPRFYGDLAEWWPLISPPEEYAEEAAFAATLLRSAAVPVRDVLELGSGGGNNASHLKGSFALTLVDLSEEMLHVSRRLNPECEHHRGDMRTVRLGRRFDAVFVHDAVDYMVTEEDLRQAVETAFGHCRPGGVGVFIPDATVETFEASTDHGGVDGPDGRAARYLAWSWDPDPADGGTVTEYSFLLRHVDGSVEAASEKHHAGLFSREDWLRLLTDAGFEARAVREETTEDRTPRLCFVGHRPVR
jgi:uncharacterized protein (TIGR03083 family)